MRVQKLIFTISIAALTVVIEPAEASLMVSKWWEGTWTCTIDKRPARMKWSIVNDDHTTCDEDACSTSSGVKWGGKFSDNGSKWVKLTNASEGKKGGLYFNHADGNRWYLAKPVSGKAKGWTTWNGNKYPLECWK